MADRNNGPKEIQDARTAQFSNGVQQRSTEAPEAEATEAAQSEKADPQGPAQEAEAPPQGLTMPPRRACGYFATAIVLALAQGFGQSVISANRP